MIETLFLLALGIVSNVPAQASTLPKNYGMILYPGFQALDVFGTLDVLNILSLKTELNLSIIAATSDPVSTQPDHMTGYPDSSFFERVVPTHSFRQPPEDLDVLIVPGGLGTRYSPMNSTVDFIAETYPRLQYLMSICTGAGLVARTGLLDGKNATGNKANWAWVTEQGPKVHWISHARWVSDGNIWTSSGVAAGIDAMYAFVGAVYGEDVATGIANAAEYERHTNASWDPFADLYNLTDYTPVTNRDTARLQVHLH